MLKLCPHFDECDALFGTRPGFHPLYTFDTDGDQQPPLYEVVIDDAMGSSTPVTIDGPSTPVTIDGSADDHSLEPEDEAPSTFTHFKEQLGRRPQGKQKTPKSSTSQLAKVRQTAASYLVFCG